MANGDRDLLDRLFSDAGNFFEFARGVMSARGFDGGDASGDEFFEGWSRRVRDLLDGGRRTAAHGLHLALDLLTLLLFALNVDLPLEELGGEADVLALLADGERELSVVDDDFDLLFAEVGDGDAADLGGLQGFFCEGGDLFGEFDDSRSFRRAARG